MRDSASTAELPSTSEAVLSGAPRSAKRAASLEALDQRVRIAAAAELRRLRRLSGLTLEHVAARSNTHKPIVCRVEKGKHTVRLETVARIAEANGGSLRDVLEAVDQALGLDGAR
jgi:hypothetical protein